MDQSELTRHGVHLEIIGAGKWRLTGKDRTVLIVCEERKISGAMRAILGTRRRTSPMWVVKDNEQDTGTPFTRVPNALSHAYAKAGAKPLEN